MYDNLSLISFDFFFDLLYLFFFFLSSFFMLFSLWYPSEKPVPRCFAQTDGYRFEEIFFQLRNRPMQ